MDLCLHDNLKTLRQKNGYSLEALAEIISVSRQTVAKWEAGDSCPELINCVKLANLYKVTMDELINKPLADIIDGNAGFDDSKLGGVLEIRADNSVVIPEIVMKMFDLHPEEKILLLADKRQGIALVKCSKF